MIQITGTSGVILFNINENDYNLAVHLLIEKRIIHQQLRKRKETTTKVLPSKVKTYSLSFS